MTCDEIFGGKYPQHMHDVYNIDKDQFKVTVYVKSKAARFTNYSKVKECVLSF